jgi:acetolactate synthase-1/2/3 large subunit
VSAKDPVENEGAVTTVAPVAVASDGPDRFEGGDLLCRALAQRGIKRIFSVSGGPINSIFHAAGRAGIRIVHTRHEAAAGFMADATARITGTPGVCAVTLGPGVTNTITAAITARLASVPILIVGGQAPINELDRGAGMSIDPLPVMASVTKWSSRVLQTERIPEYVDRAWRYMLEGRPGPVFLEIPVDVLGGEANSGVEPKTLGDRTPVTDRPRVPELTDQLMQSAARFALATSLRPVMIVGDDAYRDDAGEVIRTFVETYKIPFFLARLARGIVSESHRLCCGVAYTPANATLRTALAEADCVLLLGHFFEFDLDFGSCVPNGVKIIQTSVDAVRLNENRAADIAIQAAPGGFLSDIQVGLTMNVDETWVDSICKSWLLERGEHEQVATGVPLHPIALLRAVLEACPSDTIFVTSHGNVDFWIDAQLQLDKPGHYLRAGQSGALGAEIPFGIAAKLARPDQPVVIFVGDGGFGYHCLELDTAVRYGAPVVIVVADDQKWGAIAVPQSRRYGVEIEMNLPERDWPRLAEALGAVGFRAETPDQVRTAVTRALESGRPAVIHAPIHLVESPYMRYISART